MRNDVNMREFKGSVTTQKFLYEPVLQKRELGFNNFKYIVLLFFFPQIIFIFINCCTLSVN